MSGAVGLAAEYVLLVLDDDKGGFRQDLTTVDFTVAAAALVQLVRDGVLVLDDSAGGLPFFRRGDVPPADALHEEIVTRALGKSCDQAIAALSSPFGRRPNTARALREHVLEKLVSAGVLRTDRERLLGLIPRTRYPQVDGTTEAALRERLGGVLHGAEPDEDSRALITLLDAGHGLGRVFPGLDSAQLRRRGHELAEGSWAGKGLTMAFAQQAAYLAQVSTVGVGY